MAEICTHNLITLIAAFFAIGMSVTSFYVTYRTRKVIHEANQLRRDFEQTIRQNQAGVGRGSPHAH